MKGGRSMRAPLPGKYETQNSEFRIEKTESDSANGLPFSSFSIRNSDLRNSVAYLALILFIIAAPLGAFTIDRVMARP
jgi:hypothetical protein